MSVAAIILAAGASSRMGHFKLLADVGGEPMLVRVVRSALASKARPVIVVTGNQGLRVEVALAGLDVTFVDNPDFANGLSTSLKAGVRAVPEDCTGALVLLGDMPEVTAAGIERLLAAFQPGHIVVPVHDRKRGNPVLWPRSAFARILTLEGDAGARSLLQEFAGDLLEVEMADAGIFADIDTPEALEALRKRLTVQS